MTLNILIANPKGGCGKTTIATNLAAAFAQMGLATALADCDRQKSAMAWLKRRPDQAHPSARSIGPKRSANCRTACNGWSSMPPPPSAGRKFANSSAMPTSSSFPFFPSLFDEMATRHFLAVLDKLKPIRNNKRAIAIVGNRVRARSAANNQLDGFLSALGHDAVATLRDTQAYPTAAIAGLSIFDRTGRRIEPLLTDWQPLLRFIGRVAADRGH